MEQETESKLDPGQIEPDELKAYREANKGPNQETLDMARRPQITKTEEEKIEADRIINEEQKEILREHIKDIGFDPDNLPADLNSINNQEKPDPNIT